MMILQMKSKVFSNPKSTGIDIVFTYVRYIGWIYDINFMTTQVVLSYLIINADRKTRLIDISESFVRQLANKLDTTSNIIYQAIEELYQKKAILKRINGTEITEDLFIYGIKDTTTMKVEFTFNN